MASHLWYLTEKSSFASLQAASLPSAAFTFTNPYSTWPAAPIFFHTTADFNGDSNRNMSNIVFLKTPKGLSFIALCWVFEWQSIFFRVSLPHWRAARCLSGVVGLAPSVRRVSDSSWLLLNAFFFSEVLVSSSVSPLDPFPLSKHICFHSCCSLACWLIGFI